MSSLNPRPQQPRRNLRKKIRNTNSAKKLKHLRKLKIVDTDNLKNQLKKVTAKK